MNDFFQPGYAVLLESDRGKFLMPRLDSEQPVSVLRTGKLHIDGELQNLVQIVDSALEPGACMLDIGANIGLVSVPCARVLARKGGKVIAFEAQRIIYYLLAANCALNGMMNLHCHHLAVSDVHELLQIPGVDYTAARDFGTVTFVDASRDSKAKASEWSRVGTDTVRAITVDSMELERLDLIKADVEGMELRILAGAKQTIARFRPLMWVEYWLDKDNICRAIDALGYEVWFMDSFNVLCIPKERAAAFPLAFSGGADSKYRP